MKPSAYFGSSKYRAPSIDAKIPPNAKPSTGTVPARNDLSKLEKLEKKSDMSLDKPSTTPTPPIEPVSPQSKVPYSRGYRDDKKSEPIERPFETDRK
jgi:hypothetical protein